MKIFHHFFIIQIILLNKIRKIQYNIKSSLVCFNLNPTLFFIVQYKRINKHHNMFCRKETTEKGQNSHATATSNSATAVLTALSFILFIKAIDNHRSVPN